MASGSDPSQTPVATAAAVTTVVAAGGYPDAPKGGGFISIPADLPDVIVFHAGTSVREGRLVTAGGRALAVTAIGPNVSAAAERSRAAAEQIEYEGRYFRRDIGWREIARL